jgi:hypothetical protein
MDLKTDTIYLANAQFGLLVVNSQLRAIFD